MRTVSPSLRLKDSKQNLLEEALTKHSTVSLDTETTGLDPFYDRCIGLSFGWLDDDGEIQTAYWNFLPNPLRGAINAPLQTFMERVSPLLDKVENVVLWNAYFDLAVLRANNIPLSGNIIDAQIAHHLYDSSKSQGLKNVVKEHFSVELPKWSEQAVFYGTMLQEDKSNLFGSDETDEGEQFVIYAENDAKYTLGLWEKVLKDKIEGMGLTAYFHKVLMPVVRVLVDMKAFGIRVDVDKLDEMSDTLTMRMEEMEDEAYKVLGEEILLTSPKQVSKALFDTLGFSPLERIKTGYSTSAKTLRGLVAQEKDVGSNFPSLLLKYREYDKLRSTYTEPLADYSERYEDGRIRANLNMTGTVSGRLSSSNPNLQNQPRPTKDFNLRSAFIPEKGKIMLVADYSQLELRLLAAFSGDTTLTDAFINDKDIHQVTADSVGVGRYVGKTLNFALVYGMGPQRLAETLGISEKEGLKYFRGFFRAYSGITDLYARNARSLSSKGYVKTLLGRRRYFTDTKGKSAGKVSYESKVATNHQIQGSAADLMMLAMRDLHRAIEGTSLRMLNQVHDELVCEVDISDVEWGKRQIKKAMTENVIAKTLKIPLKVDVGEGGSWADAK